jgi:hypothetical protein
MNESSSSSNNNNDVEVVNFSTSENLSFQIYSRIAAFVNALVLNVNCKGTVITNMVDFNNASLSSLQSNIRVYAILFTFALR